MSYEIGSERLVYDPDQPLKQYDTMIPLITNRILSPEKRAQAGQKAQKNFIAG